MKTVRASIAAYQPAATTAWGQSAIAAASARLEGLRIQLLNFKPPMSRVQSACQKRDRAKTDLEAAKKT
eukprot:5230479-Lingulodinium_polyedra.AAC.1